IVGILLLHLGEEETFWLFVTLIEDILPHGWYTQDLKGIMLDSKVTDSLITEKVPRVAKHFKNLNFQPATYTLGWQMRLLIGVIPIEGVLRVWDTIFFERSPTILFKAIVSLFKFNEEAILKIKDCSTL